MERENLTGDVKGKGTSGSNREAESTDAPERGGLPRSVCLIPLPYRLESEYGADTLPTGGWLAMAPLNVIR